jgi:hypothetical protein
LELLQLVGCAELYWRGHVDGWADVYLGANRIAIGLVEWRDPSRQKGAAREQQIKDAENYDGCRA